MHQAKAEDKQVQRLRDLDKETEQLFAKYQA